MPKWPRTTSTKSATSSSNLWILASSKNVLLIKMPYKSPNPNKSSSKYPIFYFSFGKPSSTRPPCMELICTSPSCPPLPEAGILLILIRFSRMPLLFSSRALRILIAMLALGSPFSVGIKKILTSPPSITSIKVMTSIGMPFSPIIKPFWRKKPDKLFRKTTSIVNTFWDIKLPWSTLTN